MRERDREKVSRGNVNPAVKNVIELPFPFHIRGSRLPERNLEGLRPKDNLFICQPWKSPLDTHHLKVMTSHGSQYGLLSTSQETG
jgi:hypothetical protein